jgi:hypothetical protein
MDLDQNRWLTMLDESDTVKTPLTFWSALEAVLASMDPAKVELAFLTAHELWQTARDNGTLVPDLGELFRDAVRQVLDAAGHEHLGHRADRINLAAIGLGSKPRERG